MAPCWRAVGPADGATAGTYQATTKHMASTAVGGQENGGTSTRFPNSPELKEHGRMRSNGALLAISARSPASAPGVFLELGVARVAVHARDRGKSRSFGAPCGLSFRFCANTSPPSRTITALG